jgi:hypothetical protein
MVAALGIVQSAEAAGPVTTLTQNSVMGPAVAVFNGKLYVAWTGTDNPNHLNVAYTTDGVNFSTPLIIPNNSSVSWAAPGLAAFNGKLYLSWTGGSSFVNYISSSDGVTWGNQVVTGWKAEGSTALTVGATGTQLYISFADLSTQHLVQVYGSSDGVNWGPYSTYSFAGAGSPFSPAILGTPSPQNPLLVGFATYPSSAPFSNCPWNCIWVNNELVPGPINPGVSAPGTTGTGGPGLGYLNGAIYVAWNGGFSGAQGANPSIFVATYGVAPMPYFNTGQACRGNPALIGWNGHLYMVWTGSNAGKNLNIQWLL